LRGGLCCVMERHAKANNPMVEGYEPEKPTSWVSYLDCNNLYGQPMIESKLPTGDFTWGVPETYTAEYIAAMSDNANTGAFLEVDCYFPNEVHDALSDYPPMPVPREVLREELSPYQNDLIENTMGGRYAPCRKLVPDLKPRVNYVVHYRVLAYALKLGICLTKVHRVLEFTQKAWMEPYITANTKRRALATSEFEKDFWKLASNSVFGKSMEQVRNYRDITPMHVSDVRLNKWKASPRWGGRIIVNPNLVVAERYQKTTQLCKPVYTGVAVLELLKLTMLKHWYDEVKPRYGDRATLVYTDTDSFVTRTETEDVYVDRGPGTSDTVWDTSGYPKDSPWYSDQNKKVPGKFKDECGGVAITEFVALRPKMYAYTKADGTGDAKSKGTKKSVTAKLKLGHYRDVLLTNETIRREQHSIQSHAHQLYTQRQNKIALSPFDSKRWIAPCGVKTLPFGHYSLR
jgi:hypothetical protein